MAARRPRDGAAVAAASDENANPCKKARVDDEALRKTMATIGPPPAAPDPAAVPTTDVVRHLETHGYCPLQVDASSTDALRAALADASDNDNASVLQNDRRGKNLSSTPSLKSAVVALIEKSPFLHDYVGDALGPDAPQEETRRARDLWRQTTGGKTPEQTSMSADEWEAARLYAVFAFRMSGSAEAAALSLQKRTPPPPPKRVEPEDVLVLRGAA